MGVTLCAFLRTIKARPPCTPEAGSSIDLCRAQGSLKRLLVLALTRAPKEAPDVEQNALDVIVGRYNLDYQGCVGLRGRPALLRKLGFGTCVPRPAAPVTRPKGRPKVTVAMRQMTSIVGGAGLALRVGRPGV